MAKRGVRGDVYVLGIAILHEVVLGKERVGFDLVHCLGERNDL